MSDPRPALSGRYNFTPGGTGHRALRHLLRDGPRAAEALAYDLGLDLERRKEVGRLRRVLGALGDEGLVFKVQDEWRPQRDRAARALALLDARLATARSSPSGEVAPRTRSGATEGVTPARAAAPETHPHPEP